MGGFRTHTANRNVRGGKPCMRFPVSRLLGLLAAGKSPGSILRGYRHLEFVDADVAVRYGAFLAEEEALGVAR